MISQITIVGEIMPRVNAKETSSYIYNAVHHNKIASSQTNVNKKSSVVGIQYQIPPGDRF